LATPQQFFIYLLFLWHARELLHFSFYFYFCSFHFSIEVLDQI